jgi:hypothetical protein
MSNYPSNLHQEPHDSPNEADEFDFQSFTAVQASQAPTLYQSYATHPASVASNDPNLFGEHESVYSHPGHQYQGLQMTPASSPPWTIPIVPSNYQAQSHGVVPFPQFTETFNYNQEYVTAGPSTAAAAYLSPDEASLPRPSRAASFASNVSSAPSLSRSDVSRSVSPNASEMAKWVSPSFVKPQTYP